MRADAEQVPFFSLNCDGELFFYGTAAVQAVGDGSVGFQYHDQSFFQIFFGFSQGFSLRIDAGNFFDVTYIPLAPLLINRCELSNHTGNILHGVHLVNGMYK
ncbi:MAG: hypothetical protein A3A86_03035 [Elusimicrobia bacterium RIFCSPLOWO2_01_FULL_60_11]|nr:MAG: hypothetical protein A3A86_03035 [Elusimicrobia bacterium RIFCSPLOWO2_01_FULL_60_11]